MMNTDTHSEYEMRPSRQALALARRMFAQKERETSRAGFTLRGQTRVSRQDEQDLEREARRQAKQAAAELIEAEDARPDLSAMRQAWEGGKSVTYIARHFAVDPSEVGLIAWTKGWRRRPGAIESGPSSLSLRLIELLLSNDIEPTELSKLFRISRERVCAILGPWIEMAPELRATPKKRR